MMCSCRTTPGSATQTHDSVASSSTNPVIVVGSTYDLDSGKTTYGGRVRRGHGP